MKVTKDHVSMDVIAEADDHIQIRLVFNPASRNSVLYIDNNGITIFRLGGLKSNQIEVIKDD